MTVLKSERTKNKLIEELRARRLWYHDIEIEPGLRTRFAEDYDVNPVLRSVDAANVRHVGRLNRHLPSDLTGWRVLDLGCADGLYSIWAARRGATHVVGIERNRQNYGRARWLCHTLGADRIDIRWRSVKGCQGEDSFDLVLCLGLIYHLVDPLGTLHAIRRQCARALVLSSAVDLPDDDSVPLARLDRYATNAHGVWSFNVAMVRQLLVTAGFDIRVEVVDGEGASPCYFAIAYPGAYPSHHIFAETIDQEFPVDVKRRREIVRRAWRELAQTVTRPIAIFGAGTHTPWMLQQVADISGVTVACILDDRPSPCGELAGLPVRRPVEIDPSSYDAIVLSSWHQTGTLFERAVTLFRGRVRVVRLTVDS